MDENLSLNGGNQYEIEIRGAVFKHALTALSAAILSIANLSVKVFLKAVSISEQATASILV